VHTSEGGRLTDHVGQERRRISIYDPIFSEEDLSLLHDLELTVLSTNEAGQLQIRQCSVIQSFTERPIPCECAYHCLYASL
jgi:hypothetical protein